MTKRKMTALAAMMLAVVLLLCACDGRGRNGNVEYIRRFVPRVRIGVHQTWAYEQRAAHLIEELGYGDYKEIALVLQKK